MSKFGNFGQLGSLKVTGNSTNRQSTYEFLLALHSMSLSCSVPEIQLGIGRKSPFEPTPPSIWRPYWVYRWNFAAIFGIRQLDSMCYYVASCARSYVQPFWYDTDVCQTDRSTDGRTDGRTHDSKYRASICRADKKQASIIAFVPILLLKPTFIVIAS